MKNKKSFTVRSSGRVSDKYYIDCDGHFKINEIAESTGLGKNKVEEIYLSCHAQLDETIGAYYFPSGEYALKALKELGNQSSCKEAGKLVFLTLEEMEYIRQALINEGSNIINVRNDLKKGLFDKFNS